MMMHSAAGLLRLLGGAAMPRRSEPSAPARADEPDFAGMLASARAGEIHSGREVTIAMRANVTLSPEQLQRLAGAADYAEAQGATRALVLIDGQALRLDITMREVTEAVDLSRPGVLTGLDAVVSLPSAAGAADGPTMLPHPGKGRAWSNASLLKALAGDKPESQDH